MEIPTQLGRISSPHKATRCDSSFDHAKPPRNPGNSSFQYNMVVLGDAVAGKPELIITQNCHFFYMDKLLTCLLVSILAKIDYISLL